MIGSERLREMEPHIAGVAALHVLDTGIVDYAPDPAHHEAEYGKFIAATPDGPKIARKYNDSEPFSAYCFRTDPAFGCRVRKQ
jgi:hypothetical protein